jgi:hypothetical protein
MHPACRNFLSQAGIITLMEMLQQSDSPLRVAAMRLLLTIVADDTPVLESLCLVGMVPIVSKLTTAEHGNTLRGLAASFVERLCGTSAHTVQMFVACGGVSVLVGVRLATCACAAACISLLCMRAGLWSSV